MNHKPTIMLFMAFFCCFAAACATGGPEKESQTQALKAEEAAAVQKKQELSEEERLKSLIKEAEAAGREDEKLARDLINLADVYKPKGRFFEAEELYKRAISVLEKDKGPESLEVAEVCDMLAELYIRQGKYSLAKPYRKRSLDIYEKAYGPKDARLLPALENYIAVLKKLNFSNQVAILKARVRFIKAHE